MQKPRIRSDNMRGTLTLTNLNDPLQKVVLYGRDPEGIDIGVACRSFDKAKDAAYLLEGLSFTPFDGFERDDCFERVLDKLLDFAINCRRYIECIEDTELRKKTVPTDKGSAKLIDILHSVVHGVFFEPVYQQSKNMPAGSRRDTLLVGATLRSKERDARRIQFADITAVFLDHSFSSLWQAIEEEEKRSGERADEVLSRVSEGE